MAASALVSGAVVLTGPATASQPPSQITHGKDRPDEPLVIGHRGASGYRPEHTLASYRLAIRLGADFVEPDLVSTKDGVLVARHENEIGGTTDVADHTEFADRYTTKTIDGRSISGWFTEDFTLAELKTLRATERLPEVRPANRRYDGMFEVPTFDEVLDLVARESKHRGEVIGVYPETKHPTHFDSIGLSLDQPLVDDLKRHHLNRPNARVFIQSFETGNIRELSDEVKVPIIQLIGGGAPYDLEAAGDPRTYRDLTTPEGLKEIATYADGIGPGKELVLPRNESGATTTPSDLVDDAHAVGLAVHIYTMRDENRFMATNFRRDTDPNAKGDAFSEYRAFFEAGVDGVFSDHPDTAVAAREAWVAGRGSGIPPPTDWRLNPTQLAVEARTTGGSTWQNPGASSRSGVQPCPGFPDAVPGSGFGHQDPGCEVGDDQRAEAEHGADHHDQADQVGVDAEVGRQAAAHTSHPAVVDAALQTLRSGLHGRVLGHRMSPSESL